MMKTHSRSALLLRWSLVLLAWVVFIGPARAADPGITLMKAWKADRSGNVDSALVKAVASHRLQRDMAALPPSIQSSVSLQGLADKQVKRFRDLPHDKEQRRRGLKALVGGVWSAKDLSEQIGLPLPVWITGQRPWGGSHSLADRISVTEASNIVKVDVGQSKLKGEFGGGGSRNGRPDAGEWVELDIALMRRPKLPLFSTSAFEIKTTSMCVWMDRDREQELGEFRDGDRPASVKIEAWISHECADAGKIGFSMQIADSGWRNGAREPLTFDLRIDKPPVARDFRARLESDLPGYSQGAQTPRIHPKRHFELSIGLEASGADLVSAFHHLGPLGQVVRHDDKLAFPWALKSHEGRYVPTNDHDFLVANESEYGAWLLTNQVWQWMKGASPHALVAVDAIMMVETLAPDDSKENRPYVQRGYVLVPITQVKVRLPPPPPPPRVRPTPVRQAPVVKKTRNGRNVVLGVGVGITTGTLVQEVSSGPSSVEGEELPFVLPTVVLSAKVGGKPKLFGDLSIRSQTNWYSVGQFRVGLRYAILYGKRTEIGPFLATGIRTVQLEGSTLSSALMQLGFSGETYFTDIAISTVSGGVYWNVALANTSQRHLSRKSVETAPVWGDFGLVLGF